jgi:predicted DNA-binding transcriptional regulator AlpA
MNADEREFIIRHDQLETLAEMIAARINSAQIKIEDKWIGLDEVMRMTGIRSRSTIQDMRNRGEIRFSKLNSKNIIYDRASVNEFIDKHIKEQFRHGKR